MEGDEDEQMVDRSSGLASNVWSTKSDGPEESGGRSFVTETWIRDLTQWIGMRKGGSGPTGCWR